MKKFQKNSILIFLALALAFSSACGTDDGPKDKNNNTGADVQDDTGVTDTDEIDKDTNVPADVAEKTDIDEKTDVDDKTDAKVEVDAEEDADPIDPGYLPVAADSALIEEMLADDTATPSFTGVLVTFTKEAYGNDPAGFFIQAEKDGPAAFIQVDPATLDTPVKAGDVVEFDVVTIKTANNAGRLEVDEIANLKILGIFNNVPSFVQNVDQAADLVTEFADYSLELISGDFTITGDLKHGGTGFSAYPVATEALSEGVEIRFPVALAAELGLFDGCVVSLAGTPLWSFNSNPQVSAWTADDLELSDCDLMAVSAKATSATTVDVTFSRDIDPATLLADGSQFVNTGADENFVTGAVVVGNVVTLTTGAQTPDLAYALTVANTLADTFGVELQDQTGVEFTGFNGDVQAPTAANQVVLSEIMAKSQSANDPGEYIELYNPSADKSYDLNGCSLFKQSGTSAAVLDEFETSVVIAPGQYLVFVAGADQLGAKTEDGVFVLGGLGNNANTTIKLVCDAVDIDTVKYPNPKTGQSFQKSADKLANVNDATLTAWCETPTDATYEYVTAKFGTPGAANFDCP